MSEYTKDGDPCTRCGHPVSDANYMWDGIGRCHLQMWQCVANLRASLAVAEARGYQNAVDEICTDLGALMIGSDYAVYIRNKFGAKT